MKKVKKDAGIKAWNLWECRSKEVKRITEEVLVDLYLALDSIAYKCYAYDISWHQYCKIDAKGIHISIHDYDEIEKLAEEGNSYAKWIIEIVEKLTNPKSLLILRIKRLLETGTFHVKLNSAPDNGYILVCEGNTIYEIELELVKKLSEIDNEIKHLYEKWKERLEKWQAEIPKILETFKHYSLRRVRFELRDALAYLEE